MRGGRRRVWLFIFCCCSFVHAQAACEGQQECSSVVVSPKERGGVDSPGCGTGSASPCATLGAAIRRLPLGGTVLLEDGEYSIRAPRGVELGGRNFTVKRRASSGSPGGVVLRCSDGAAHGRCFHVSCEGGASNGSCSATAVRIEGVTMTGGVLVQAGGGAVSVDGPGLFLSNVDITHSRALRGGGVSIASSVRGAELHNVRFRDCRSFDDADDDGDDPGGRRGRSGAADVGPSRRGRGGAIWIGGSAAPVVVSGARFSACAADEGGAVSSQSCNLTLENCEFVDSYATHTGGAVTVDRTVLPASSHVIVANCTFRNVSTTQFDGAGGAVLFKGRTLAITDSHAQNCSATEKGGGFLYCSSSGSPGEPPQLVSLVRTRVESCRATLYGGGIAFVGGGELRMTDTALSDCSTPDAGVGGGVYTSGGARVALRGASFLRCSAGAGGAVYAESGSLNATGCQFSDCSARLGGCLAANGGRVQLASSRFDRCHASQGGAVASFVMPEAPPFALALDGCGVSGSSADLGGGVFTSGSGELSLRDSNFTSCTSVFEGGGVDVLFDSTNVTISRALFQGCSSHRGGALSMVRAYRSSQPYACQVSGSTFANNTGSGIDGGGALYLGDGGLDTSIADSLFLGNVAETSGGGAIVTRSQTLSVQGSTFRHNQGFTDGGAILYAASAGTIAGSTLVNNTSHRRGGVLFLVGQSQVAVSNSTFSSNSGQGGGVLGAVALTHASFSRCRFSNNSAQEGGCFLLIDSASLTVALSLAADNAASREGGVFYASQNASVRARAAQFVRGRAMEGGVLFASGGATVALESCLLSLGGAVARGGALSLGNSVTLDMRFCEASNNSAPGGEGGFLHASGAATCRISDTRVVSNSASEGGAVSAGSSSVLSLARVAFSRNRAGAQGGAVSMQGESRLLAGQCKFVNNTAALAGGAIYAVGSAELYLNNSQLTGNRAAASAGGAVCCNSSSLLLAVDSCTFSGNAASTGGALANGAAALGHIRDSLFKGNAATVRGGALEVITCPAPPAAAVAAGSKAEAKGAEGAEREGAAAAFPLALARLRFGNNSAYKGGAIYQSYSGGAPVFLKCAGCADLGGNRAAQGPFQSSLAVAVRPLLPTAGDGTSAVYGSSLVQLPPIRAELVDAYGQVVLPVGTTICRIGPEELLSGTLEAVADNGTFSWMDVAPVLTPQTLSNSSSNSSSSSAAAASSSSSSSSGISYTVELSIVNAAFTSKYSSLQGSFELRFCAAGQYFEERSRACVPCTLGHYCEAAQALQACPPGTFSFRIGSKDAAADCRACGTGLTCAGGNISVDAGYWTNVAEVGTLARAYRCRSRGCQGAQLQLPLPPASAGADPGAGTRQCAPGYLESRTCGLCDHEHYSFSRRCAHCSRTHKRLWWLLAVLAALAWAVFMGLANVLHSVSIIITELQLLCLISFINLNRFPAWVRSATQVINITLFQLEFLGPHCVMPRWGVALRFAISSALALLVVAAHLLLLLATRLCELAHDRAVRRPPSVNRALNRARRARLRVGGMVHCLDMLYVPLTLRCFEVLLSVRYDRRVLSTEPSVTWHSPVHLAIFPFAVSLLVFAVGMPLFSAGVLIYGRRRKLFGNNRYLNYWWWMFERFRPGCWWWYCLAVTLRRLVMALVIVFWATQPQMQGIVAFLITLLVICGHCLLKPLREANLNVLVGILLVCQFMYISADLGAAIHVNPRAAAATAGAGILLALLTIAVILPHEVIGTWRRMRVHRWARRHSQDVSASRRAISLSAPQVPSHTAKAELGVAPNSRAGSKAGSGDDDEEEEEEEEEELEDEWKRPQLDLGNATAIAVGIPSSASQLRPSVSKHVVPMKVITSWFHPHVMHCFLEAANPAEVDLLFVVREQYSAHAPRDEELERMRRVFHGLPVCMDYAVINQLVLAPGAGGNSSSSSAGKLEEVEAKEEAEAEAEGKKAGSNLDALEEFEAVSLLDEPAVSGTEEQAMKLRQLQRMAAILHLESTKGNESLRLLVMPGRLVELGAWLIGGGPRGRVAFRELMIAMRRILLMEYGQKFQTPGGVGPGRELEIQVPLSNLHGNFRLWALKHFP